MPAFYIVLQEEIPGIDATGLEGRRLSQNSDQLDALARSAGVKHLMSFFSAPREATIALLDCQTDGIAIPEEQWFAPEDGLRTIALLTQEIAEDDSALAKELAQFQLVLEAALARNVCWHLALDY